MGKAARDSKRLEPSSVWFAATVDDKRTEYKDPHDITTPSGISDLFWQVGFVTGWAAHAGFRPNQIKIEVYDGDKLIGTGDGSR